ncbi:hypothetical protein AM493_13320 [Flavobacterium akiainvivens]|uniref:Oxygen tolerance n=1 Tax=Flavobacterium akiainvivens TaxID=1202724 RepID=A0A0M9VIP9_9FLAO|nr:hypothetical protein [Flavobacterium akiainvivens]KOS06900.1 hypothetical protein AM493_13320 [Flavobacterium akiainvivens]SFQ69633.1 hypothetical protein SAMN05444144_11557 [Flavobacterium akiainvivens]
MKPKTNKKLYILAFLFAAITAFGQQKQVQVSIDSTKIKIGSQANVIIKASVKGKDKVNFPQGKTFGQLEVLEAYPTDTVKDGNGIMTQLIKKYGVTQFDTGQYVIPRLPVVINNKTIQTDSLRLHVTDVKVDTLKQKMYDIKTVTRAPGQGMAWYWYIVSFVLYTAVGFGIWWFFFRKKGAAKEKDIPQLQVSPIEKATSQLKQLEKKDLLQRGEVKEYYSEMANIARQYIEEAVHIPAMESTTGELIEAMQRAAQRRKMTLRPETFEQLEQILRNADLVKFAKSRPMDFEIAEDRSRIEKTIVVIDRSIPEEKEEDDDHTQKWLEEQRLKKEKQKRRLIIWSSVGAAAVILLTAIIVWGVPYVRDNVLSEPTKQLVEGEWVKSEYGNPGVSIETPEVLVRIPESTLPQGTMALVKDMQSFSMGSIEKHFYVEVATLSFKEENDVDFATWSDGIMRTWESKGAKDILTKTESFKTDKGLEGVRIYGTLNQPLLAGQGSVDCKYEMYLFKQQKGLQQVVVIGRTGDEYATKIMDRIKKSIELRAQ